MRKISSIGQLKHEACGGADFALLLKHGLFSRKTIAYDGHAKIFSVWNHIDDTRDELTEEALENTSCTNIGKAIRAGAFAKYEEETA